MRNWYILFTSTFTVTTLTVILATWIFPFFSLRFSSEYIATLAVFSALLSLIMLLLERLSIKNAFLSILVDIAVIFTLIFTTGLLMQFYTFDLRLFFFLLALVIFIYLFISLIYLFVLTKEANEMNQKLTTLRNEKNRHN